MLKDFQPLGEIPTAKQGFSNALDTAWAAIAETFLVALIATADTLMVSRIGEHAVTAVGICTQPRYLAQTLILALNIAITSICARRKGENDQEGASSALKQGLILSGIFSVILTLIFYPMAGNLIKFMGAQPDAMGEAIGYFSIIVLGLPLNNIALTISAAQRGVGETKASMVINMSANIVNVVFNYLLINGVGPFPRLGVKGAAVATVIGWAVGLVVALASVSHKEQFLFIKERQGWKLKKSTLSAINLVATGSFAEQFGARLGFIMFAKIVSSLGTKTFALHEILMNMASLSFSFGEGFSIAAAALVGQNLGIKRPDLSLIYGTICQRMSLITSGILSLFFMTFGAQTVFFFIPDPSLINTSRQVLAIMSFIVFFQSSQMVFMGALRGAGDTKYTAVVSIFSIMLIRPAVGYVLTNWVGLGLVGAWLGLVVDQFIRLTLTYRRFNSDSWMEIEL